MELGIERMMVNTMYYGGKLSIRQIAAKLGKSKSWVYSRLNERYTPVKSRADKRELAPATTNNAHLIQARKNGATLQEISNQFGVSVSGVYNKLYSMRDSDKAEKVFCQDTVIPYLIHKGHKIVSTSTKAISELKLSQRPDILSILDGRLWVTEVKFGHNQHNIFTGIGQLVMHGMEAPFVQLHLVASGFVSTELKEHLKDKLGIEVTILDDNRFQQSL